MHHEQQAGAYSLDQRGQILAHVTAPGLEVMAAASRDALPDLPPGDERGAELRAARDGIWQWNEPRHLLLWVCRAIPADLLSQSHLQRLAAGEPLLEGRSLA